MKRGPLRPVSARRLADNRRRRTNLETVYGHRPACHACLPLALVGVDRDRTGCNGWAQDAHELVSRGRGGSIVDPENVRPVSRACHRWITEHPGDAEAAGLALPGSVRQPLRVVDPRTGELS